MVDLKTMINNHYTPEHWTTEHPPLKIGEIINDFWVRIPLRDDKTSYPDNYYYTPSRCYCNDLDSENYTYQDEYGDCDYCNGWVASIKSNNHKKLLSEITPEIEKYLIYLQSGKLGIPTIESLQNAANLHRILEG